MNIKKALIASTITACVLSTNLVYGKIAFTPYDVTISSGVTVNDLRKVVPETMKDIVNDIVYYSNQYGVNELFLTSIIRLESGNNTSTMAQNKNNLGGIRNKSGNYHSFSSKQNCIEYMAKLLSNDYLNESGKYYNGKSIESVCINYNGTHEWCSQVESISLKMYNDIRKGD